MSENERRARKFCHQYRIGVSAAFRGDRCPELGSESINLPSSCPRCGAIHGDRYRVTLHRIGGDRTPRSIRFDVWGSRCDGQMGKRPTTYGILTSVSSDAHCPDTLEEFCEDHGYNADDCKAGAIYRRLNNFAAKLRAFFTEEELEALTEIQ